MRKKGEKTMKRKMASILCALMMALVPVLPARADGLPGNLYMYVETGNSGRLHLRSRPDGGSESLGLYRNGTLVLVEGFANGCWAAVLVNGRRGYMNMNYLSGSVSDVPATEAGVPYVCPVSASAVPVSSRQTAVRQQVSGSPAGTFKRMYVRTSCGSLHLRAYASQSAESLGLYPNGTQVFAADLGNGWSYVLANGLYGCMMTQYLSPDPPYSYTPAAASSVMHQYASAAQLSVFCYPQPKPALYCGGFVTVRNPNSSFVYLRSSKDSDRRDNILAQVSVGTQVTLLEAGRYWSRVRYDGLEGFMVSSYLK